MMLEVPVPIWYCMIQLFISLYIAFASTLALGKHNFSPSPKSTLLIISHSHTGKTVSHRLCLMNQESMVCVEGGTGSLQLHYSSKQNSSNSNKKHRQNSGASGWCEVSQDLRVTSMEVTLSCYLKIRTAASAAQRRLLPLLNCCLTTEPPRPSSAASSTYWEPLGISPFPLSNSSEIHIYISKKSSRLTQW